MSNTNYVSQRRLSLFFNRLLNMFITRKEYNNNITHYDNRRTYTYNPNEVNSVNSYTLICDEILSPEEFTKSVWSIVSNGETYTFSPEITTQFSWLEEYKCYFCSFKTPFNYIESTQDIIEEFQCLIFPYATGSITTPGAYITKENLSSYELPNKIINISIGEVKTLDEKFIPNVFVKDQQKGAVNGVATLDENGKVPLEQLPDNIGGGITSWHELEDKPTDVSVFNNDAGYLTEIPAEYITENELDNKGYLTEHQDISNFVEFTDLSTVATSGKYEDLDGIPSEFTPASHDHNGSYYTEAETDAKLSDINTTIAGLESNKASVDSVNILTQSIADLGATAQTTSNLVTSIESTSTDAQYPSAKAVYDTLAGKQDALTFDDAPTANSTNPVSSGAVRAALDGVIQIAEGKCSTYIFDYYDTLYDVLVGDNQDPEFLSMLNAGDIFLIRDLKVPDYWWEPQGPLLMLAQQEYADIIVDGYGAARVLETTKIDLDGYAKTEDLPTNLADLASDATHRLVTDTEKATWNAKSNFSGNYNDLTNKPTIPSAYTHPATHPVSMITGLATVATSGSYNDLSNKPTIPTVPSSLPANGGNADTIDGYHIRTGTSGADGYITFVV